MCLCYQVLESLLDYLLSQTNRLNVVGRPSLPGLAAGPLGHVSIYEVNGPAGAELTDIHDG